MSIEDSDGTNLVTLEGVWTGVFKLFLVLVPVFCLWLAGWGCWVTLGLMDLRYEMKILSKDVQILTKRA